MARTQLRALIIELIPHVDAGDRGLWRGDQDERPLSELGRRQAEALARYLLDGPVDRLFSSPALRCLQTLEPSALSAGVSITVESRLREQRPGETEEELAERGLAALEEIGGLPGRRALVCSHGDLIPAAVALLVRRRGLTLGAGLGRRGEWYTIDLSGRPGIALNPAPDAFPR